jgi:hypothetical protein
MEPRALRLFVDRGVVNPELFSCPELRDTGAVVPSRVNPDPFTWVALITRLFWVDIDVPLFILVAVNPEIVALIELISELEIFVLDADDVIVSVVPALIAAAAMLMVLGEVSVIARLAVKDAFAANPAGLEIDMLPPAIAPVDVFNDLAMMLA